MPSQSYGRLSFRPLSLATLDSSPSGRAKKEVAFAHSISEVWKGADARAEIVNINHNKLG